jgi:hypothetical protein
VKAAIVRCLRIKPEEIEDAMPLFDEELGPLRSTRSRSSLGCGDRSASKSATRTSAARVLRSVSTIVAFIERGAPPAPPRPRRTDTHA